MEAQEKQHEMVEMLAIVMDWEQGDASLQHEMEDPEHYKKCGDLWRKFYDILNKRHNVT